MVELLENAGISWKAYAEPDFGSPLFDVCPLDFTYFDVEHLAFVYFNDVNGGLNPQSADCRAHVRPYYDLPTDLATHSSARYNFITPNLCHDGHEGVSPCSAFESADNTLRSDTWLKQNVPLILESAEYQEGGALFIIWDEAEDNGPFSDGPIGMFLLSPFAKGGGKRPYPAQNTKALVPMETCTRRFRRAELAGLNVDVQFIRDSPVVLPMAPEGPTRR